MDLAWPLATIQVDKSSLHTPCELSNDSSQFTRPGQKNLKSTLQTKPFYIDATLALVNKIDFIQTVYLLSVIVVAIFV